MFENEREGQLQPIPDFRLLTEYGEKQPITHPILLYNYLKRNFPTNEKLHFHDPIRTNIYSLTNYYTSVLTTFT